MVAIADDIRYMPVSPDSFLFKAGAAWQFPAFVICLGSSYLQRMLARLPQLAEAVLACPGFEEYAAYLPELVSCVIINETVCCFGVLPCCAVAAGRGCAGLPWV
jgi:hypothetical protein